MFHHTHGNILRNCEMHANKLKSPITCDVYQLAVEMCRLFFSTRFFFFCALQNLPE